jgi:hypothetical protein
MPPPKLVAGSSAPTKKAAPPVRRLDDNTTPLGVTTNKLPLGSAGPGRPPTNLGNYLIRPTAESDTGYEMLNDQPKLLDEVEKKFLKIKQLPPGLAPTKLVNPQYTKRPQALEAGRKRAISRGFRKPRSQQG